MKRIIPMAVAGLFVATAAFATVDHSTPIVENGSHVVTDTIPAQQKTQTTFPKQTKPTQTEPATEPAMKDNQNKMDDSNPFKKDDNSVIKEKDTTPSKVDTTKKTDTTEKTDTEVETDTTGGSL